MVGLQGKRDGLEQLRGEAEARKRNFDQARIQYKQRAVIRDERRQALNELRSQIDKYRIEFEEARAENRAKERPKTAKVFKLLIYEDGKSEPKVTLNIPLVGLKAANDLLPSKFKEKVLDYGLDLEQILKQETGEGGWEPITLLDVKDRQEHIIISLE